MTLVIANALSSTGLSVDLVADRGVIVAVGPGAASVAGPDAERVDAGGRLLLPALVEGHVHLDKTLIGLPFIPHIPGDTVAARIDAEKELRRRLDVPVTVRGGLLIERLAAFGTTAVRSHVDIDTEIGLAGLEAVLSLRETHGHLLDIQTVAFPQSGILRDPGTAELLDAAVAAGADLVGGLDPAGIDGDVEAHLDVVFAIADKHGVGIDLHLHDAGALGAFELRRIAERTIASGLQGKVAVSHAFCLGALDPVDFGRTADLLARAGVAIMTTAPGPVPMPPVKPLRAAGVRVFAGNDNIRDAWSPLGSGDLLERAAILCDRQDFRSDPDLELAFALVTREPAAVIGRRSGLEAGDPADVVLLPAGSVAEAVAARPRARTVFKGGRRIAEDGVLLRRPDVGRRSVHDAGT